MAFLRQQWYAAGWSEDLKSGTPVARTILGEKIVLWRDEVAGVGAVADLCPHRYIPLSMGTQEGNALRCRYHGLKFDMSGRCTDNPHGPIAQSLCVKSYPVVERHKLIWIWMGDKERADPAAIVDYSFLDKVPETAFSCGYIHIQASHKVLEDNILDITHADYLHPDILGGGSATLSKMTFEERGKQLYVHWFAPGAPPLPIFGNYIDEPNTPMDMWTEVFWHPNGAMILHAGSKVTDRDDKEVLDTWNAHIATPETETTTHYFYANTRDFRPHDAEYNAGMKMGFRMTFSTQDKPFLEAQQAYLGERELLETRPHLLPIDGAAIRARRMFDQCVAEEKGTA